MNTLLQLSGAWQQTYSNDGGIENPEEEKGLGSVLKMNNGYFYVYNVAGNLVLGGEYQITTKTRPYEIHWLDTMGEDQGKLFKAIFEVTNDSFKFSASDEGFNAPSNFEPKKGHTIRAFKKLNDPSS